MIPAYIRVKSDLEKKIQEGIYTSGKKIPSERALCEIYAVSRMTIRQAINQLIYEGSVIRKQGSGTYVATPQFKQKNVRSFTETVKAQGYEPSTEVLEFSKVHHIDHISALFSLPNETQFYKLKRIRRGNKLPMALETVYFPEEKFKGIQSFNEDQSLYEILKVQFGCTIDHIAYDIDACISNRMMMSYFELDKPVALLKITGISYTSDKVPVLYEESYYRPDLYKYQVDIYKR